MNELGKGSLVVKFLVTGAAGFIGSHICDHLIKSGHQVTALDNLSNGSLDKISHLQSNHSQFEFIKGDITDLSTCEGACKGQDYVIHQAALGSVPRSMEMPDVYTQANAIGTLHIFMAAQKQGVKRVVYASSSSVYGNTPILPKVETMQATPLSPYAVTKYTNELFGAVYNNSYHLETIGLRYFNIFGPRQNPDSQYAAVIPKFIQSFYSDTPITVHGDGLQTRDFTYVANAVAANIAAIHAPSEACGQAYNIGCSKRISLIDLIEKLGVIFQKKPQIIHTETRAGDVRDSLANIDKAKSLLSYSPAIDLSEGLKKTVEWYIQRNEVENLRANVV